MDEDEIHEIAATFDLGDIINENMMNEARADHEYDHWRGGSRSGSENPNEIAMIESVFRKT